MPGAAAAAPTARMVVDERDPAPVCRLRHDLVAEHLARVRGHQLLDVGAAEPAGKHLHGLAGAIGFRHLGQARPAGGVEDDGAHGDYRRPVPLKLHRCKHTWLKSTIDACWRVQRELNDAGIPYEVVKGPGSAAKRKEVLRLTGQRWYPVIEFEDGSAYRAESKEMAETIRAGRLFDQAGGPAPTAAPSG